MSDLTLMTFGALCVGSVIGLMVAGLLLARHRERRQSHRPTGRLT